ncbi:MAG: hypothetical protein WBA91_10050 [Paracoccaceae bacterium]
MESTITTSTNGSGWAIVPANTLAGVILGVLFIYVFFRHIMFMLMFFDMFSDWPRNFSWFLKEGKRRKRFIHWIIALALLFGFLFVGGSAGWLEFIPQ